MARLAVDIGGTFTDAVYLEDETGESRSAKLPTTSENPVEGIQQALDVLGVRPDEITSVIHGNTLVVNVIVERKGARTALVTTAGFRDVLEIARGSRTNIYDFTFKKPEPFVPRDLRFEVRERIDHNGNVLSALALTDADKLVDYFRFEGVESVAIQFMHSYAEPQHEILFANYLASRLPDIAITTSSELTREWGEYERANTAVLNAYVQPKALFFLEGLETALATRGFQCPVVAVQSNGGHTTTTLAKKHPITLIESGPAAGIGYVKRISEAICESNVIFFDVGGTTAKCAVLENRETPVTTEYRLERSETYPGYPIKIPVVDVVEIGTGGGSIAKIDPYGILNVGPESAGAAPGPACFGKGGTQPTTTDAMLHLGILNP
ncbi:MAG: hydantoinase/oxoprolinase family protein, partial [Mesorhizobium sp.]|nr:hydantoinase/oxoprolinase family protein [Mesorhizobium sp.]